MLKDLSGVGALQDSLATTNSLLADVLSELKLLADVLAELKQTNAHLTETNSQRLEVIAAELRTLGGSTTPEA
jgi:hypothetical protein